MTRINLGYPPKKLTRLHLLSEIREIKRIPNCIKSGKAKLENATNVFKLGAGHVTFFYRRLGYLKKRYIELYNECLLRGYNVTNFVSAWDNVPEYLMNDYEPTDQDKKIIEERIKEKTLLINF